ncbi:MAG: hypothetical protein ACERKT_07535, partial [Acidobacteriota bacterium]
SKGMSGFACGYAVTNNDLSKRLRSLFGGPPGARTRDHRIKSPTDGLSTTTTAKRVQQTPTDNTLSFNTLTDVCFAEEY